MFKKIFNFGYNGSLNGSLSVGREKRILESYLLSPDYDYLQIDENGFLINPYPIFGSDCCTYDKVEAASIINGLMKMGEFDNLDWDSYYDGVNEIYVRAGRQPICNINKKDKNVRKKVLE